MTDNSEAKPSGFFTGGDTPPAEDGWVQWNDLDETQKRARLHFLGNDHLGAIAGLPPRPGDLMFARVAVELLLGGLELARQALAVGSTQKMRTDALLRIDAILSEVKAATPGW